jgi:hypothetical protein
MSGTERDYIGSTPAFVARSSCRGIVVAIDPLNMAVGDAITERKREGYLTLAVDLQKYVELAINLAMSLRIVDPKRPICLVHDAKVRLPQDVERYFDDFMLIREDPAYVGVMYKILLHHHTPYERTMFVDADCVMVREGVDSYWSAFAGTGFNVLGSKLTRGRWGGHDVTRVLRRFHAPFLVSMNSGVFYFDRGARADRFFALADHLYREHAREVSRIHQGRWHQFANEPILGLAMGLMEMEPQQIICDCGSLMVTTWRARRCRFDLAHRTARIEKPADFFLNLPLRPLARRWVVHHPIFAHFVGIEPRAIYRALANQTRELFDRLPAG